MYRLCYEQQLIPDADPLYVLVDFVPDMDAFRAAVDTLRSLQKDTDRIKYVEAAYQAFLDLKESMREYSRIGQIKLEMLARSFFVEFDVFLNHWEKRISRHLRKEEFKNLYEQLTHNAYDNSDNYAMAVIIRNYAIHSTGIINGTVWGKTHYDVSIWRYELLKDKGISSNRKEIIKRQQSSFILLHPMMKGALAKLKEIQDALIAYIVDEETKKALSIVAETINKIREYGDKRWFLTDDTGSLLTEDEEGQTIEYVQGKCLELFYWRDFDELIRSFALSK